MPKKPANLVYGVNDKPPLQIILVLAFQHAFFLAGGLILATVVMREIGGTPELIQSVVTMAMIAGGIATILQALGKGPIGSGYLCTEGIDPTFISSSILAGATGGVSLIFGMTMVAGVIECMLAPILRKLRILFPPEVTGTVLTMVGLNIVPIMILNFLGVSSPSSPIEVSNVAVAIITLGAMVGINIWGNGKLRLYSITIGMAAGYVAAYSLGVLKASDIQRLVDTPFVSFPNVSHLAWSFDIRLLIPILIATLASMLKSVATLAMCQKINDSEWVRPDLANIARGTFADGLASVIGGLLGGMGQCLYPSSVGLSVATGATSRIIAFFVGGIFISLAFLPKLAAIFTIMPRPVMGGALVFMVCFTIISGIQIITSRMIDTRRTFVIAISLMFGISVDMFPQLYQHVHPYLKPLFSSSLAVATMLAVVLNMIVRIGITKHQSIELTPCVDSADRVFDFMENLGAVWGARKEVVVRAASALVELLEAAQCFYSGEKGIQVKVMFDEFNLDVKACYQGQLIEFPTEPPNKHDLLADPLACSRMAGFLVRQYVDHIAASQDGQSCRIELHFDH